MVKEINNWFSGKWLTTMYVRGNKKEKEKKNKIKLGISTVCYLGEKLKCGNSQDIVKTIWNHYSLHGLMFFCSCFFPSGMNEISSFPVCGFGLISFKGNAQLPLLLWSTDGRRVQISQFWCSTEPEATLTTSVKVVSKDLYSHPV